MDFQPINKKTLSDKVRDYLYKYIKGMDTTKSTKLPAEDIIAQSLGVSRITIRKALADLESNGVVFRVHGKGTFVNPEALKLKVNIINGFEVEQMIRDSGYDAKSEVLHISYEQSDIITAKNLNIEEGSEIVRVEKLFYADSNPAVFCIDRFPRSEVSGPITEEDVNISIFKFMIKRTGKIVTWDNSRMYCTSKSKLLELSNNVSALNNDSLLVFDIKNYDKKNNVLFSNTEIYDSNYISFNIIRQKNIT